MDTKISNGLKNFKYFILLALFPIFSFTALIVSKEVFAPRKLVSSFKILKINEAALVVEIANTPEKQTKGLAGRKSMPENQGMLFVFDSSDYYAFWMKGMLFNLDFIWIRDNKVVEISKNIRHEDYQPPEELIPEDKVDSVMEVNSGTADRLKIKIGDRIGF